MGNCSWGKYSEQKHIIIIIIMKTKLKCGILLNRTVSADFVEWSEFEPPVEAQCPVTLLDGDGAFSVKTYQQLQEEGYELPPACSPGVNPPNLFFIANAQS